MTITPASNIPVSVDYTSKDYYSIREELIERIQDRIPDWKASDPADFGVALVEAFAYVSDILSYYIDRNANEAFITTASQRDSVLNIARNYGYTPAGYRQALVELTFTNTSATEVTLPEGTVVSGDVVIDDTVNTIYFTTVADAVVAEQIGASPGETTVTAAQGRSVILVSDDATTNGELIGTSTGLPAMSFEFGETPVVEDSIEVYVQDGVLFVKWTEVQHLSDYGPNDQVYVTSLDEDDIVTVEFGDGVSGAIPTLYSEIRAKYTVGGGNAGNVDADTIDTLVYVPGLSEAQITALQADISVANGDVAFAGADPESTEQIRTAAPLTLRANNRAVTLNDFANLALSVTGIGKANATATVWTSVTVYIAPTRTATDVDAAPGLDEVENPTAEFDRLKTDLETFYEGKTLIGTSVTISPPVYVDVNVTIQYTKLNQYTTTEIETSIKEKMVTAFGYSNVFFEETINSGDLEFELLQIPGIQVARVTQLYRTGSGAALTTLQGDPDEIFRFTEDNLSIGEI
jgi:hypothetical protein